jgi:integrase
VGGKGRSDQDQGSKASVPVIAPLRQIVNEYKATTAGVGWMFPGQTGKPFRLHAFAARVMKPAFEKAGLQWKGWYAFRRGAATYLLLDLGLDFDSVRAILRHELKSKVLEKHYAAEQARRAAQKRVALAIGQRIDAQFAQREQEILFKASQGLVN